jgi:ABC-type multidrug transport system ATPase subunit
VRRRGPLPGGPIVPALSDLSIRVNAGEIFGFLGPNGAGKSTMIRLLLGFLHPTAGRAEVLGLDSERASVEIRRRVGYLPGGIALYDGMAGVDLLDYLGQLYGRKPIRRAELLDRLELSERTLRRPVRDYSRGMRQKIGIVQALQHDPELAILDEPTEGLDPSKRGAVLDLLAEEARRGTTILLSSHHLGEVDRACDRLVFIAAGRMLADETAASVAERARRHVRLEYAPEAGAPHVKTELDKVAGVESVRVEIAPGGTLRAYVLLRDDDPRAFLSAAFALRGLPPPAVIGYGQLSLSELYRELYGVEGC